MSGVNNGRAFRFEMNCVDRDNDPYYITRWDLGMPVTVVAATRQEAGEKLQSMLGKPGPGQRWVYQIVRVDEVLESKSSEGGQP